MSWTYKISTGQLFDPHHVLVGIGFSGQKECLNNPNKTDVSHLGPLPIGKYTIEQERVSKTLGPVVIDLTPDKDNEMFGRSLFRMHGVSKDNPLTPENETLLSSHGCICMNRIIRNMVSKSEDRELEVIA